VAKLTPKTLSLSDDERTQLQQLRDRHNRPQQIALGVRIILMASDSQNHREIARSLDINRQMARLWRNRGLETDDKDLSILQRLQYQERVGPPVKFSMEQVIEWFAFFVFPTRRLRQANKSLDISEHWQMKS
jgi:putative transposase